MFIPGIGVTLACGLMICRHGEVQAYGEKDGWDDLKNGQSAQARYHCNSVFEQLPLKHLGRARLLSWRMTAKLISAIPKLYVHQ